MYKNKKIVTIIPARGGSKRLPRKNILPLAGKPLIGHSIESSLKNSYIDKTIVSTDNSEIAEISSKYGAEVIMRPEEIATDTSPPIEAYKHVLSKLEQEGYLADIIIVLQPTNPLRTNEELNKAIEMIIDNEAGIVISVNQNKISHKWLLKIDNSSKENMNKTNLIFNEEEGIRTQDQEKSYEVNGNIFGYSRERILKGDIYDYNNNCVALISNKKVTIDIDDKEDFEFAELIFEKLNENKIDQTKEDQIRKEHVEIGEKMTDNKIIDNNNNNNNNNNNEIRIDTITGKKVIGENQPIFIIAEAGVNHNGDFELAKKLIDAAKYAGADAVKFQTANAEEVVSKGVEMANYQKDNLGSNESQLEMIKKIVLPYDAYPKLKRYCDEIGILFLSAPHSIEAVDFLDPLMPLYKVPSPDVNNYLMLEKVAEKGKPIILSVGMSNMADVKEAISVIKNKGNEKIIILQCTTDYPCEYENVNLRAMLSIKEECGVMVGYSDHTIGLDAVKVAASLGAIVLEKHFTLDKNLPGPDHKASMTPDELKELIETIKRKEYYVDEKNKEVLLGNSIKEPCEKEVEIAKVVKKSIVAKQAIAKGTTITEEMIALKRPSTGISPKLFRKVIGKTANDDIQEDELFSWEKLSSETLSFDTNVSINTKINTNTKNEEISEKTNTNNEKINTEHEEKNTNARKVLVIAAHPDDEVLGVGGVLLKHKEAGDEINICIVTKGYVPEWEESDIRTKVEEGEKIDQFLCVKKRFNCGFPTAKLNAIPHGEFNKKIQEVIDEVNPDLIYTHYEEDIHKDHRVIFNGVMVATRPIKDKKIDVLCFETVSSSEWNNHHFSPNHYVNITNQIDKKIELVSLYKSELKEFPHPRSRDGLKTLARKRGMDICIPYAEAFKIVRSFS
ncbi:N-acetylneuraminate synthase [Candidatus Woesearchaeota archaeon]|nr:N-acetylneuraminate synthase [Candidatus Woesearchaeota archaeon]